MDKKIRSNIRMMLIVEQGIAHDALHGSVQAWRFLAANEVPAHVILRVLSEPARRRHPSHALSAVH